VRTPTVEPDLQSAKLIGSLTSFTVCRLIRIHGGGCTFAQPKLGPIRNCHIFAVNHRKWLTESHIGHMHGGFKGNNWRTERRSPLILFGPRDLCTLESSTLDFRQLCCSTIKLLCTGLIPCTLQIPFFLVGGGFAPINSYNRLTPGRWVELNWYLPDPLTRLLPTALQQASIKRSVVSVRPSVSTLSFEPTDLGIGTTFHVHLHVWVTTKTPGFVVMVIGQGQCKMLVHSAYTAILRRRMSID